MKLNKEYFDNHEGFDANTNHNYLNWYRENGFPDYNEYTSKDGRIIVKNIANLSDDAWNFHVDDDDFCSLASFDVETVEDANTILKIYGLSI